MIKIKGLSNLQCKEARTNVYNLESEIVPKNQDISMDHTFR